MIKNIIGVEMNFDEYDEEYNEDENFSNENDLDLEDEELSELKQPEEDDSENVNILKEEFKKEKKNMYFDEELVKDLLINKYQISLLLKIYIRLLFKSY